MMFFNLIIFNIYLTCSQWNSAYIIAVNSKMQNPFQSGDGWASPEKHQDPIMKDFPSHLRYHFKDKAREILDAQHYSLQPDMAMGWRPKLPSCPLPLTYPNPYLDSLLPYLQTNDRFKLVYLGPRPSNSVQVNQQHDYIWRYRSRYNTTITAVKQAIKRVGQDGRRINLDPSSQQITFDSSFESGNLDMAVRVKPKEYDLFIRSDTNTRGHTCWFYFKVCNKETLGEVQFNIVNFSKKRNMYSSGLKPYTRVERGEWNQDGCYDVLWAQRLCRYGFQRKNNQVQLKYYFKQKNQTVYFAYSIPYTFSQLQGFIKQIRNSSLVSYSSLCETLGGLQVPLLTITNQPQSLSNSKHDISLTHKKKKIVLLTARIHPGQPHSSHVLQGFIRKLLSSSPQSQALINQFVFYIVPMLNPDGVVAGNFRTSFSGKDLNRQFNKLNKFVFPQVTALHDFALRLKRAYHSTFQFYFDFHAHSCKKGIFCYGPQHPMGKPQFFRARALAKIIQQKNPIFSYRKSIFTISQHKKTTGRAHMLWKIKIPMTFTFEVSNGLYQNKQSKNVPFKVSNLLDLGQSLLLGMHRYGQLQMRLPSLNVKAKVDTGITKRRLVSSKQFRKSLVKKQKNNLLKQYERSSSPAGQTVPTSLKLISGTQPKDEDRKDFLRIMKQIRKQETNELYKQTQEYQGGSDSESQGDDLEVAQLRKLHNIIETRNDTKKGYSRDLLQWKTLGKKETLKRQSISQEVKENRLSQDYYTKKIVTSKYLQHTRLPLPPRTKKLPFLQNLEKMVLLPKYFDLDL